MTEKNSILMPHDMTVTLLEGISSRAEALMKESGYTSIITRTDSPDRKTLSGLLDSAFLLGIRSRTALDAELIRNSRHLMAVGCFCIGTDGVDLNAAALAGIPVFNAPFSNTRSVAELVMAETVMLMRGITDRSAGCHRGEWLKSAKGCHEVRGKTLGIIGYGNIGSQLAALAEAFGMRVIFHDTDARLTRGNAVRATGLSHLLEISDVISLHVPDTASTRSMIGEHQLRMMKPGALLINASRGRVVDIDALSAMIKSGHIGGAAVDVFPTEPVSAAEKFMTPLAGLPNVILTPHIGGSTEEAQERIGEEVANRLIDYSETGSTSGAVNFPEVRLPARQHGNRYMNVHRNEPGAIHGIMGVLAGRGINITAQYLQTAGDIGYTVIDTDTSEHSSAILGELAGLPSTVRTRLLKT